MPWMWRKGSCPTLSPVSSSPPQSRLARRDRVSPKLLRGAWTVCAVEAATTPAGQEPPSPSSTIGAIIIQISIATTSIGTAWR